MSNGLNLEIQKLEAAEIISVTPERKRNKFYLIFSKTPPNKPGVYVIYDCGNNGRENPVPFYVGETRNLLRRLKFLFRFNAASNPHPCQINFAIVAEKKLTQIECKDFCNRCQVKFISTEGMVGRLEIEEKLQTNYGTNCDAFYKKLI